MKKIILLISLLTVTLNTSPVFADQHSELESKQTNNLVKNNYTKQSITKKTHLW